MVIPSMRSVGDAIDPRNTRSLPIAVTLLKHLGEIAGNRHLFHRVRQLPVLDPQSRRAARVVARHNVRARSPIRLVT